MNDDSGAMRAAPSVATIQDLIAVGKAGQLEAQLAPLLLVGPAPSSGDDWTFRTASLNLMRETINGHEMLFDASFLVHPVKKSRPGPFATTILIGRSASNDICVAHSSVSKLHARISLQPDGTCLVSDAGSSNGTALQGKKLVGREERALVPGMLLLLGSCHFTIVDLKRFGEILLRIR